MATGAPSRGTQTCPWFACEPVVAAGCFAGWPGVYTRETFGCVAPQRLIGHANNVGALVGDNPGCGSHPRLQRQVRIVDTDDDVIGDDILHGLRRLTDLADRALKHSLRKRVDGETTLVFLLDTADIALAHIGVDLHLLEIAGDKK